MSWQQEWTEDDYIVSIRDTVTGVQTSRPMAGSSWPIRHRIGKLVLSFIPTNSSDNIGAVGFALVLVRQGNNPPTLSLQNMGSGSAKALDQGTACAWFHTQEVFWFPDPPVSQPYIGAQIIWEGNGKIYDLQPGDLWYILAIHDSPDPADELEFTLWISVQSL